jgi:hypothetical protein
LQGHPLIKQLRGIKTADALRAMVKETDDHKVMPGVRRDQPAKEIDNHKKSYDLLEFDQNFYFEKYQENKLSGF